MKSVTIFGKKLPLAVLAAVLVIGGAGAAAGVTMQGDVQGDTTTKVDQAVVVSGVTDDGNVNNGLGTVSDDKTSFKHSANINQGDEYTIKMNVTNRGSQEINGRLVLDVPEPLEVEVSSPSSDMDVARTSMYKWQFQVDSESGVGSDLEITVATPDDVQPGFYDIEGEIRPEET